MTQCKYKRIGCPWHGPFHELTVHEAACAHPTKTGNELMEILDEMDQSHRKEMQLYNSIFSLLSFEKIGYTGEVPRCLLHAVQGAGSWEPGEPRFWAVGAGCTGWLGSRRAPGEWGRGGSISGEKLDQRLSRGRARAGSQGRLHGSHGGPSHLPTPARFPHLNKVVSSRHGAAQTWETLGSNQKVGVSGGLGAGGQKNTCHVGSCLWVTAGATGLLRPEEAQGKATEQAEGAQLERQSWERTPRDRQAGTQLARWISQALLATDSACRRVDSRGRARARSRPKEQQGAPADAGAAQGGSGPRLPSPRQVAS